VLASPGRKSSPQRQQTRDATHSNNNKAADHGERIIVDSQHTAPHRDIASEQPDCSRLGSKFLWLRCNDPIFYCGTEMAETRVMLGLVSRDQRGMLLVLHHSDGTHRLFETAAQRHGFVGHDADAVGHVA
jgi:hypothetical protein